MPISAPHFYIIYTPGTVRLLIGFVFSLLKWSKAEFTLVSNDCSAEERNRLKQLCVYHARLHYKSLNSKSVMSHGAALNQLQSQNNYPDFGVIDSDIYATEEFDKPFIDFSDTDIACHFIPSPASFRLPDEIHRLKNNRFGCSYFMRYDNAKISHLRNETGAHFDKYQWQTMPLHLQQILQQAGLKQPKYDTARLINALLLANNEKVVALDDSSLRHLGGVSRLSLQRQRRISPAIESLISLLPNRKMQHKLVNIVLTRHQAKILTSTDAADDKRARKRLVNHYFYDFLMQLSQQVGQAAAKQLPPLPKSGYSLVDETVGQISHELIDLYASLSTKETQLLYELDKQP